MIDELESLVFLFCDSKILLLGVVFNPKILLTLRFYTHVAELVDALG